MKKQLRTQQTKQKLMDAFWTLYCEKNIDKITVKDITAEAGFYRSTFYEYFSDVYAVLDEIEETLLEKYRNLIPQIISTENAQEAQILAFNFYALHGEQIAVLLGPNGDQKFYLAAKELVTDTLKEKLNVDMQTVEAEVMFEIMSSSVISMLGYWYKNKDRLPIQHVLHIGSQFMINGALPYINTLFEGAASDTTADAATGEVATADVATA